METDDFQLQKCCRACKSDTNDLQDLYGILDKEGNSTLRLSDMIMECTTVRVQNGDGLPPQICMKCISQLEIAYNFKKQCENVDISFRTILAQQAPQLLTPPDQKLHECDVCLNRFCTKTHLQRHVRSRHSIGKLFRCKICDKSLTRMEHIRRHMTIHLKNKPFKCRTCKRGFNKADNLRTHEARCTGQRPHICPICNRGFGREDSLQVHMDSTHTGADSGVVLLVLDSLDNIEEYIQVEEVDSKYSQEFVEVSYDEGKYADLSLDGLPDLPKIEPEQEDKKVDFDIEKEMITNDTVANKTKSKRSWSPETMARALQLIKEGKSQRYVEEVCGIPRRTLRNHIVAQQVSDSFADDSFDDPMSDASYDVHSDDDYVNSPLLMEEESLPAPSAIPKTETDKEDFQDPIEKQEDDSLDDDDDLPLQAFVKSKKPETDYNCPECHETFTCSVDLQSHKQKHHAELLKKFHCLQCPKQFKANRDLRRHVQSIHEGIRPFKCSVCEKTFSRESHLSIHMSSSHSVRGRSPTPSIDGDQESQNPDKLALPKVKLKCPTCQKGFMSALTLEIHSQVHTNPQIFTGPIKMYNCTQCPKSFPNVSALKRHILSLHVDSKPFSCTICDKKFTRKDHLTRHIAGQHDEKGFNFSCTDCNKTFPRNDSLVRHRATHHGEGERVIPEKKFTCVICTKSFTTEKYRDMHMRAHDELGIRKTFSCKTCEQVFEDKGELAKHLKSANDCSRRFLCSECGQRFTKRDYLEVHLRRHRGEKPFKCKFCGKGFPRTTDLKAHEKCHTGEKTHLCIICGKGFGRAYKLTLHMRTHTGEKPYRCQYCESAFAQSNDLKAHTRRHTGERYYCDVCNEGFLMGYMLTQHKKQVHGIDLPDSQKAHARLNQSAPQPIQPEIRNPLFLQPTRTNGIAPTANVSSMGFHDFFKYSTNE